MKDITLDDIIEWVIKNSENRKAIDKINTITFPFTTKYLSFNKRNTDNKLRVESTRPKIEDW